MFSIVVGGVIIVAVVIGNASAAAAAQPQQSAPPTLAPRLDQSLSEVGVAGVASFIFLSSRKRCFETVPSRVPASSRHGAPGAQPASRRRRRRCKL